jgi:hypothetical protein
MPGGGGLLQLVAQGKQDVFLTGNPQITWFKMVYRRYTNFAMESQAMYFDGDPDFGKRLTCVVPRRGDLLGPLMLEVVLPRLRLTTGEDVAYVNSIAHALIEEITLEIGEQEIDKQTGEWMELWSTLTVPPGQKEGFDNMVGRVDGYNIPPPTEAVTECSTTSASGTGYQYGATKLYIPLQFWFTKNPGLYLPLIAMQYHPIRLNMKLRSLQEMFFVRGLNSACGAPQVENAKIIDLRLWGDYIYLDTEERRRFVANTHEYLIEQIQYTPKISIPADVFSQTVRLEFNHPVREMIWRVQRNYMETTHEWFNFSSVSVNEVGERRDMLQDAIIQVDGFDRFDRRDAGYFRLVQPFQYHTNIPTKTFIYTYSFSLRPEEMQPSGSLNASRIDNMILQVNLRPDYTGPMMITNPVNPNQQIVNPVYVPPRGASNIRVYAKNHNVLRVVNGYAGLLFKI